MSVTRVGGATPQQEVKQYTPNTMDKNAFLNLLVTQLRNQNPLQPMEDKEFISQMAQFSSLEQMQNMNKLMKENSAYGMIDKLVKASYTDPDKNETKDISGVVTMARVEGDKVLLKVNGIEVPADQVKEVTNSVSQYDQMQAINQNFKMSSAFSMIGKEVKAKVTNSTTKTTEEVTGTVESVRIDNGSIYVQISGREVPLETIYYVK
jgi:flagellar basal-body rod modification protein FlgD